MTLREPDWTLWRSFLAAFRESSLSGAARALGLTQPTVGRHVAELEAALGTALFTRAQHGLDPTATALALAPYAESMSATAAALLRVASGEAEEVRGTVRVTASEVIGAEVLPPILGSFREAHPAVSFELVLSNQTEDLLRRQADIAIRMVRPTQAALVARHVGRTRIGLYAHRDYLRRHGVPDDVPGLRDHIMVGFDSETPGIRSLRALGLSIDRGLFAIRTDSDLAPMAAIRSGAAIGACQIGIARRQPELIRVLKDLFSFDLEMWVAMHEDLKAVRRMRLMFDHLVEHMSAYAATSKD